MLSQTSPPEGEVADLSAGEGYFTDWQQTLNKRLMSQLSTSSLSPQPIKRHVAPKYDVCSIGRSMIEMLGVLAIISVLSVGGIAGYSKALEKYKINKAVSEYSNLIFGLLEHKNDLEKLPNDTAAFSEIARSLNLVPPFWTNAYLGGLRDDLGNIIRIKNNYLYRVEIIFNNRKKTSKQFISQCRELVSGLIYPLQNVLILSYIWHERTSNQEQYEFWYGSKNCAANEKCIGDVTLSDIEHQCMSCLETGDCLLLLHF